MTEILKARSPQSLARATDLLLQGEVIALPTDTVYGVAALAFDAEAVAKIYQVKERPFDKAIPVFVPSVADLSRVCRDIPPAVLTLLEQYWPGALTVILPVSPNLPGIVTNNGPTVAVRMPDHPVVMQLLAMVGQPLAATSANISGKPNPQTAADVEAQLQGRIPLILDDGPTPSNLASTILDVTQWPPQVVRQGALELSDQF